MNQANMTSRHCGRYISPGFYTYIYRKVHLIMEELWSVMKLDLMNEANMISRQLKYSRMMYLQATFKLNDNLKQLAGPI